MSKEKVKVTNMTLGKVVYPVFNKPGIKRIFPKQGSFIMIEIEELEESIYQPGVRELFEAGCLKIEDEAVLELLGLIEISSKVMLDLGQCKELLASRKNSEILKALKEGTTETRNNLVTAAQEIKFMDTVVNKWFIQYCGVDVIQTITLLGEDEKPVKKEK